MTVTLDWLGVSTYRLKVDDLVIFLDAYLDRVPGAPPTGLKASEVQRADWIFVGHSHFDHLWGAEKVARNTGAKVVGSYESIRVMHDEEVPESQLMAVAGGERIRLSERVSVRVFPSQHSCIWAKAGRPDEVCLGDQGLALQERLTKMEASSFRKRKPDTEPMREMLAHLDESDQHVRGDGGALAYLIETPYGSILWKDTSGHWTGILRDLRPDIALLAAAGRGNVDGDPVQGSLANFITREVDLVRPRTVSFCHHDNWMPPLTRGTDLEPVRVEVKRHFPHVQVIDMGYMEDRAVLR